MGILTREMVMDDLTEVIHIHQKAFKGFFLTFLGDKFLYDLYKSFIRDKFSICIIAEENSMIRGFIVGNVHPNALFKKMLIRQGYIFLWHSTKAFFKNPVLVTKKFLYALKYRGEAPHNFKNAALLSSIGVDPEVTARGFGYSLVSAFCKEARSKGSDIAYLTTDKINNDYVNSFYIKTGFSIESEFKKPDGRMMYRYIKHLDEKII